MRSLIFALIVGISVAHAQPKEPTKINTELICFDTKFLIDNLAKKYKEVPTWAGKSEKTTYSIFANPKTGEWTLIEFTSSLACVHGVGTDSSVFLKNPM